MTDIEQVTYAQLHTQALEDCPHWLADGSSSARLVVTGTTTHPRRAAPHLSGASVLQQGRKIHA